LWLDVMAVRDRGLPGRAAILVGVVRFDDVLNARELVVSTAETKPATGRRKTRPPVGRQPHADAAVRRAEAWLAEHFREPHAVAAVVKAAGMPECSLKRRFKVATGSTIIDHVQNLRIEEAKRLLEIGDLAGHEIAAEVGYENPAFFHRLFSAAPDSRPASTAGCSSRSPPRLNSWTGRKHRWPDRSAMANSGTIGSFW
jgi:transcriptional regulator GlxA family with amidase domain